MENNLVNITHKDPVYTAVVNRIARYIPNELKPMVEVLPQSMLMAGDSYFIHYSYLPILRSTENPDKIMEKAREFMSKYVKSSDYVKIKPITTLDDDMSSIYSISFMKKLMDEIKNEVEKQLQQSQSQGQDLQSLLNSAMNGNKKAQKQLQQLVATAVNNITKSGKVEQIMKSAVRHAEKITNNASKIRDVLGLSAGKKAGSFEKLLDLAELMKDVKEVRRIFTIASDLVRRMPKFAKIKKIKSKFGNKVAGYMMTKKIEKAIPRELALPDELFYAKLASSGFISREKLYVAEGAYYVVIDKSGSMSGEKTIWARSVALALFKFARTRKRKYFLRFFDHSVYPNKPLEKAEEIVDYILKIRSDGGTSIDNALRTAVDDIIKRGLSKYTNTIIIITDGEDNVETKPELLRSNGITLVAVMIQGKNETLEKLAKATGGQYLKAELTEGGALELIDVIKR